MLTFYEFFAGGGMAAAGLGSGWRCLFANDIDLKKAESYRTNWGGDHLNLADVASLSTTQLPDEADLSWASFPCQDLSLAGKYAGLSGKKSGTFWPYWALMEGLISEGRGPRSIVLENVYGALTSRGGKDFAALAEAFAKAGYVFGALVMDASLFLPQSRKRLFIVGVKNADLAPSDVVAYGPNPLWHPKALCDAVSNLSAEVGRFWRWWNVSAPAALPPTFSTVVESSPAGVAWHAEGETQKLLGMMSDTNLRKIEEAKASGKTVAGTVYKRTRIGKDGIKRQRAEIRLDGVAGCLRTPAGGSSRQIVMIIEGGSVRSRLLSPREAARLMGLPDQYKLPGKYNDAYHLLGDGVAVPVVEHLSRNLLEPILKHRDVRLAA